MVISGSPAALDHDRDRGPGAEIMAGQVEPELGLPAVWLELQQVLGQRGAGVADPDIDAAQKRVGTSDERGDCLGIGHVGREELSLVPLIPDGRGRLALPHPGRDRR